MGENLKQQGRYSAFKKNCKRLGYVVLTAAVVTELFIGYTYYCLNKSIENGELEKELKKTFKTILPLANPDNYHITIERIIEKEKPGLKQV